MTHCMECGKPWGVILDRGQTPTPEIVDAARRELLADLRDQWDCDYEPEEVDTVDWTHQDFSVRATEVVYLTEALARFCDENGICDPLFLDDCWQELAYVDLPGWLLKGRNRRWAILWDCCGIGNLSVYVKQTEVAL